MTFTLQPLSKAIAMACAGATIVFVAPAVAQESSAPTTLDRVQVTGSRIPRVDMESSQPVFSLGRDDILAEGLTSVGDVLQNLSIAGYGLNTNVNNGGNGETRISLRNLGASRTLVLVNGRRWVGGTGLGGPVDINTIPTAAVERIEVLKDGASVIYGADAIAGVVNIILRSNFDGFEANAYYGQYGQGDGAREAYDVTVGGTGDRWSTTFGVGYVKEEPVMAGDRTLSAVPTFGTGNYYGSSNTPNGRFGFGPRGNLRPDGSTGSVTNDGPGTPTRPYVGGATGDAYNFAPDNYLVTPQERISLFGNATYDLTDRVRFLATATYNERESEQLLAAMPVSLGAAGPGTRGADIVWSADSIYNPFGQDVTSVARRVNESGGRSFRQTVDTTAASVGLEGDFDVGSRYYAWDVGYFHGRNKNSQTTEGLFTYTALANALGPSFIDATGVPTCGTPGAPIAGCVPLDIYGAGSITPEMLDYLSFTAHDNRRYQNSYWYATISGDIVALPAGPLQFSFGAESRTEKGYDQPDALINAGDTTGNARTATIGSYDVDEAYLELNIPILANMPGARLLDLNVASRYSDYSSFGDTTNSKAGFRWKPIDDLMVRGNYTQGFRAPAISELFQGRSDSYPSVTDPCSIGQFALLSPDAQGRCLAQGVPAGGYAQANSQQRITVGGNPDVQPETSTSKTLGFVYSPSFAPGLDVSVDWWNIEIRDTITTFSANNILTQCIVQGIQSFCDLYSRTPEGPLEDLLSVQTNIGSSEIEGFDVTLNYSLRDTRVGDFSFTLDTTYIGFYKEDRDGDGVRGSRADGDNLIGTYGNPYWRLRSNLGARWRYGDFGATWNARYYSGVVEACQSIANAGFPELCSEGVGRIVDNAAGNPTLAARNRLGGSTFHDVSAFWEAPWEGRVTLGANNVLNKEPPRSVNATNSFPAMYDIPGRFVYMRYSQRF